MGRRGFPSRSKTHRGDQEDEEEESVGYYWDRPSDQSGQGQRHVPPCSIRTSKGVSRVIVDSSDDDDEEEEEESTTPTAREARIPDRLPCPPAPRKTRPCGGQNQYSSCTHKEFFLCPPDLEAVFARRKPQHRQVK